MEIILNKDVGTSKAGETVKVDSVIYSEPVVKKEVQSVVFKGELLLPADFQSVVK